MTTEQKIERFTDRLMVEFPDWPYDHAAFAAARIVEVGEKAAFQLDAERGIAEIPVTTDLWRERWAA